jgi:hypothetical protein
VGLNAIVSLESTAGIQLLMYICAVGPVPLVSNAARVMITPSQLTIPPGGTSSVSVTFNPPTGLNPSNFPVYSGYIQATGSDNSILRSTYMGVAAKMKDMKVLDNTATYLGFKLPFLLDANKNPIPEGGSVTYTMNGTDVPSVVFRLVASPQLLRLSLIDIKTNVTTLANQARYLSRNTRPPSDSASYSAKISEFANGTAIPNGTFKLLIQALKITGNQTSPVDYDSWTSPSIIVKRAQGAP